MPFTFPLLLIITVTLASLSGVLYHRNKNYEYENRRLIIQNDSIMSVNIELKNAINLKFPSAVNKLVNKTEKAAKRS